MFVFAAGAGCPLILTDMDAVDKVQSLSKAEREFLCALLFHTINWFREVTAGRRGTLSIKSNRTQAVFSRRS